MTYEHQQAALAAFGSAARGDHDAFSDRDLLVVTDDVKALKMLKSSFDSMGWSCTAYSWNRLQHAADHGSLFVQHLKQESNIYRDPSNRLADLLANFSTKASYKQSGTVQRRCWAI